ncbi:hypothetical protein [Microtetraspora malaysiensis]|uniref:phage terminase small subunit n=1 Tax=Microtetraspora malaysiensis TaxID=161358 RepID=UPI003D8F3CB3
MAGMGPPPKRNARRRNARPDWRTLPAAGRAGDPPPWPYARPSAAQARLWADLWATPQAAAWEELGWARVVARYTKLVLAAEKANAKASLLAEVRQLEDRLGLSPMAMRRLQWEIGEVAEDHPDLAPVTDLDTYRELYG